MRIFFTVVLQLFFFVTRVYDRGDIFRECCGSLAASSKPLQSFDVRCDWLSLIYRGPGSVNFKLTDKKSTATIRTHRFFLRRRRSSFFPQNGNNTAVVRVLAGGHKRLVVWKLSADYFSPSFIRPVSFQFLIGSGFISRLHCSILFCSHIIDNA